MNTEYFKQYEPFFGSWYIKRELGKGSYGRVFEIIREEFGETFTAALKVVSIPNSEEEWDDVKHSEGLTEENATIYYREMVEGYTKEFVLMSKLKGNSNIVSYEDHQVIERKEGKGYDIFIRMELLTPLYDYLDNHAIDEQDVVRLGMDICSALELCENNNIIHRDIKPENIFISASGDFKLGDFGVARIAEKTVGASTHAGSPDYMAPEVAKGIHRYDNRVDIYSLGLVMYRLLNGNRFPFLPPTPEPVTYSDRKSAYEKRLAGELPLPAPAMASEKITQVILKACAFKPDDRFYNAEAMQKALSVVDNSKVKHGKREQKEDYESEIAISYKDNTDSDVKKEGAYRNIDDKNFRSDKTIAPDRFIRDEEDIKYDGNVGQASQEGGKKDHARKILVIMGVLMAVLVVITSVIVIEPDILSRIIYKDRDSGVSSSIETPSESASVLGNDSSTQGGGISEAGNTQSYGKIYEWQMEEYTSDMLYDKGLEYLEKKDYSNAYLIMNTLANDGYTDAINVLGVMYQNGYGVSQDYEKAFEWYFKGANLNEPYAQANLGILYENGWGVRQNYGAAVIWYREAVKQGNQVAQCNLAILYDNGRGVQEDARKAVELLQQSAIQDYAWAQYCLGNMYYWGRGVNQDYQEALKWYQKATDQGVDEAQEQIEILNNEISHMKG